MNQKEFIVRFVKDEATKLLPVIEALYQVWPDNRLQIMCVLVQNLAHKGYDTFEYSFEREYTRMDNELKALKALEKYYPYHTIQFIVEELEMSYCAASHIFSEQEEEKLKSKMQEYENN